MEISIDLHIHSKYAYRTSKYITRKRILEKLKNMQIDYCIVGDLFYTQWVDEWADDDPVIWGGEIIGPLKVHYLIILESKASAKKLYDKFKPFSKDIDKNGRPTINMDLAEISKLVHEENGYIGGAHIFHTITGLWKLKNKEQILKYLDFCEVGLDARLENVGAIPCLLNMPLICASDAHSVEKIGREFMKVEVNLFNIHEIFRALKNNYVTYYKIPPELGSWYDDYTRRGKVYLGTNSLINNAKSNLLTRNYKVIYRIPQYLLKYPKYTSYTILKVGGGNVEGKIKIEYV